MRSANNSRSSISSLNFQSFSGTHVDQSDISIARHHDILRLQISINDPIRMQMLHHKQDLTHDKFRLILGKSRILCDGVE